MPLYTQCNPAKPISRIFLTKRPAEVENEHSRDPDFTCKTMIVVSRRLWVKLNYSKQRVSFQQLSDKNQLVQYMIKQ